MSELLAGRYRLLDRIGEGGMAVVYRAEDTVLGRTVAIKVLRDHYAADPDFRQRFQLEARTVAGLSHPHVVNLFDVGEEGGRPFLVMEYVDGPTLKEVLRAGSLGIGQAVAIAIQVCEAVAAAHACGIVHRDIKPQNILLRGEAWRGGDEGKAALHSSPSPYVKIADFGIARALGAASFSETGQVLGSIHYLSPEQIQGKAATQSSDIYAIGVVLYEMLTGRTPFQAETVVGIALQHIQSPPPSLRELNPAIPPGLESIVLKALAKEPADRYPSAAAMGLALKEYLQIGEEATLAVPELGPAPVARVDAGGSPPRSMPTKPVAKTAQEGFDWLFWLLATLTTVLVMGLLGLGYVAYNLYFGPLPMGPALPSFISTPTLAPPTQPPPTPTATPVPLATVPSVVGLPDAQARSILEARGLVYRVLGQQYSDQVVAGAVITQSVPPNQQVEPGTEVGVVLSKGPPPTPTPAVVQVPSVVGFPYADAVARLRERGLEAVRKDEANTQVEPGIVFRQEPPAGQMALPGSKITLLVSKGPPKVVVPDVVGKPEGEAIKILQNAGLKLWRWGINYQGHGDLPDEVLRRVPVGAVLSTTPPAGTEVPPGTEIQVAVRKD